jgi:hypothetical protein
MGGVCRPCHTPSFNFYEICLLPLALKHLTRTFVRSIIEEESDPIPDSNRSRPAKRRMISFEALDAPYTKGMEYGQAPRAQTDRE